MSEVGESSQPPVASPELNPQAGTNSEVSGSTSQSVKTLKFNSVGLPIGPDSGKAATKLGKLTKTHIPICFSDWRAVPRDKKDAVWEELKELYNYKDSQRSSQMKKACDAWKKYKGKMRKLLKGNDILKWLDAMPKKGMVPDHWKFFCENEHTADQIELRARNKMIKNDFGRQSTHNTGRLGYARAEEKFKEENNGRNPMRVELWLYTHKRKEGGYAPHDEELARKLEGLLAIMHQTGGVETLDSGPIFDTFGVDKGGRVRCVGPISRKALLASSFARQMLEEVDLERDGWRQEMNVLQENNEKIMSQLNELVEGLKSGRYNQAASQHTPTHDSHNNASNNHFGSSSYSQVSLITSCAILSHTGVIVAYGTKTPVGTECVVNGHCMQPREAKVLIDDVKDRSYSVWGGEQDGAKTLGEVSRGSSSY